VRRATLAAQQRRKQSYRELKLRGVTVRVGIEASRHDRWFHGLLAELDFELWVGDAAQIKAKRVRKQKKQASVLLLDGEIVCQGLKMEVFIESFLPIFGAQEKAGMHGTFAPALCAVATSEVYPYRKSYSAWDIALRIHHTPTRWVCQVQERIEQHIVI
jgi:hypothetical protein